LSWVSMKYLIADLLSSGIVAAHGSWPESGFS